MHRAEPERTSSDVARALADENFLELVAEDIAGHVPLDLMHTLLQLGKDCVSSEDTARPAIRPSRNLFHAASLEGTVVGRLIDALRQWPCNPLANRVLGLLAYTTDFALISAVVDVLVTVPHTLRCRSVFLRLHAIQAVLLGWD